MNSLISLDHLLRLCKMNLVIPLAPAALMTHIFKWLVSLITDIFAMPEDPGLLRRITCFSFSFLLPFKSHAPYPSNRTHLPRSQWQGARTRAQDPYCLLSLSPHTGQIQLGPSFREMVLCQVKGLIQESKLCRHAEFYLLYSAVEGKVSI